MLEVIRGKNLREMGIMSETRKLRINDGIGDDTDVQRGGNVTGNGCKIRR